MTQIITSPLPPSNAVMPESEAFFTIVWGVCAVAAIAHAIWSSSRQRSLLPLAILVGATLAMGAEALVINYMHAWYPAIDQINAYHAVNQSIPVFVALAFVFFFSPAIIMLMNAFERGVTIKQFWIIYGLAMLGVLGYETTGLYFGFWSYYGYKPLLLNELPGALLFINATLVIFPATIFHCLKEHIVGWRLLLVIAYMAGQVSGMELLLGYPMYFAINANIPPIFSNLAALVSVANSIGLVWVCSQFVCKNNISKQH